MGVGCRVRKGGGRGMIDIEYKALVKQLGWIVPVERINFDCKTVEVDLTDAKGDTAEYDFDEVELLPYIGIEDIHGKKVFRRDIVKVKQIIYTDCSREEIEEIREYIGEVVWHLNGWFIAIKKEKGILYHSLWLWNIEGEEDDTMEILGNRWDNPEMKVIE